MVGYPLFLRSVMSGGSLIGFDGLFSIVLIQRLLVLGFGLAVAKLFRWWGVALFAVLFSIGTQVYINYLLAESLALSLTAMAGLAFGAWWIGRSRLAISGTALLVIVAFLSILRAQYLVLWIAPLLVVVALWFDEDREPFRWYGAAFGITLALTGLLYIGVVNENHNEHGSWAPVVNDDSVDYLAAWTTLFVVEEIPLTSDELVVFYDDGTPWPAIRELDQIEPSSVRTDTYNAVVNRMIGASGMSRTELRLRAFLGALVGGRADDMRFIKTRLTNDDLSVRLSSTYLSGNVQHMGEQVFLDRYNEGEEPAALVLSPAVWFVPELPQWAIGALWVALFIVALIPGLAIRWQYAYVGAAVLPHLLVSAVGAWILGDNYRWLLPTLVFPVVALFVALMVRAEAWTAARRTFVGRQHGERGARALIGG